MYYSYTYVCRIYINSWKTKLNTKVNAINVHQFRPIPSPISFSVISLAKLEASLINSGIYLKTLHCDLT